MTAQHTFATAGLRSVRVTVVDDDGGTATRDVDVVVADATSSSFVTGSAQWIGAAGSVTLTTEVRYRGGVPAGSTRVDVGARSFRSAETQWLVVDGARATWSSTGSFDGASGYRLLVSVVDQGRRDLVRTRLLDAAGAVVWDTQPGAGLTAPPTTPSLQGNLTVHVR